MLVNQKKKKNSYSERIGLCIHDSSLINKFSLLNVT